MSAGAAVFAVEIGDPDATRTVIAIIALMLVMGVALVMLALWQRRETRPDPTFLAPLELMGERAWRRGDPVWQRRRLDEVRPEGAEPLEKASAPPRLDEAFDAGPSGSGFDDLRHDEHGPDDNVRDEHDLDDRDLDDRDLDGSGPDEHGPDDQVVAGPPDHDDSQALVDATVSDAGEADSGAPEREWPPRPPTVGSDGPAGDRDRTAVEEVDHDRPAIVGSDHPPDGRPTLFDEAGDTGPVEDEHGDRDVVEGRTPIGSRRPWLDLPERDIDPDALRRAMEELDAELGGPTGDA